MPAPPMTPGETRRRPGGGLSAQTPFGYAGGYTDPTGLVYLIGRYYDPGTGQFLNVDPLVGVTEQPYSYSADDPVDESDPSGLTAGHLSPQAACQHSSNKSSCEVEIRSEVGGVPCSDRVLASQSGPEALLVVLTLATGGVGDVVEAGLGSIATRVAATEVPEAASVLLARAGPTLVTIGVSGLSARALEIELDQIASNPSYPAPVRAQAAVDSKIVEVADLASDIRDIWEFGSGQ